MAGKVKPVPDGFHTVTPHLVVRGARQALDFYQKAFGAEIGRVSPMPGSDRLMHATFRIGDSNLMLADDFCDANGSPAVAGKSPVTIHLYLDDVDAIFNRAVAAGATVTMPLWDAFWGDRYGQLVDPFGQSWSLATHIADPTPQQMEEAMNAFFAAQAK
jgi:uncharacterized glyoxalase superfamily protein PhnB